MPLSNFARNIRILRHEAGFSQKELARRAKGGLRQQDIWQYERGLQPSQAHVAALARAFDVPEEALHAPPVKVREELLARAELQGRARTA